jgi:hypothetical protein
MEHLAPAIEAGMKTFPSERTTYRPASVATAFARVLRGENPRLALGDFLDDWRRTPGAQRHDLVAEPIGDPGTNLEYLRWAAFFAAATEQLCFEDELPFPSWTTRPEYHLLEPWFLVPGAPLRAWQLVTTPVPFKMRNIFGGDALLQRA